MFETHKIKPALIMGLLIWTILFALNILHIISGEIIRKIAAAFETGMHVFIVYMLVSIYSKLTKKDKNTFIWLFASNVMLFITDITWWIIVYIFNITSSSWWNLLFSIPYLICLPATIVFLSKLLTSYVKKFNNFLIIFTALAMLNALIMIIFLHFSKWGIDILSSNSLYQIITAVLELIIFDLSIFCLSCCESKGVLFILSGIIVIMSGDFWIKYCFITQTFDMLAYGELFWMLGLLLNLHGVVLIKNENDYNINLWFRSPNSFKSRLILWCFAVSVISFVIFSLCVYMLSAVSDRIFAGLPFLVLLYSTIVISLSFIMGQQFEQLFKKLGKNIEVFSLQHNKSLLDMDFHIDEFVFLNNFTIDAIDAHIEKDMAKKRFMDITVQVAHDIRSPLASLNTCLKYLPPISENQRVLIRNVVNRINDIANNLLSQYKIDEPENIFMEDQEQFGTWLIAPLLESMISEKRLQFECKAIQLESKITHRGLTVFSNFDIQILKRIISNLINNSEEAITSEQGKIDIILDADSVNVMLRVIDNGCGIAEELINKIVNLHLSQKEKGHGLGLQYSKKFIETWGGKLILSSKQGVGTEITIILPIANSPKWFASELLISHKVPIVILDDDPSIHEAWDERLSKDMSNLEIYHFKRGAEFKEWFNNNPKLIQILSDYELLGESDTGLDILENLNFGSNAILVTSYYENQNIIAHCEARDIKMLPKNLVAHIPIRCGEITKTDSENYQEKFDLILIDDDDSLRNSWELSANMNGKKILTYNSINNFEKVIASLNKDIPIYIDSDLGSSLKGEDYALSLFNQGFTTIYLTTGFQASHFKQMIWIKAIVGKEPIF